MFGGWLKKIMKADCFSHCAGKQKTYFAAGFDMICGFKGAGQGTWKTKSQLSGQIIATSHDLTPKGS